MVATVMAVPSPMTKVAAMPAQNKPCASANTSTRIAPEQGLMPTVKIALKPRRQPPGPASSLRLRAMGVAAMLVMDVVVAVIVRDHGRGDMVVMAVGMDGRGDDDREPMSCGARASASTGAGRGACSARMKPPPLVQTSRAPNAAIRA